MGTPHPWEAWKPLLPSSATMAWDAATQVGPILWQPHGLSRSSGQIEPSIFVSNAVPALQVLTLAAIKEAIMLTPPVLGMWMYATRLLSHVGASGWRGANRDQCAMRCHKLDGAKEGARLLYCHARLTLGCACACTQGAHSPTEKRKG